MKKTGDFEQVMNEVVVSLGLDPILQKAVLYTLKLPGKRLRPRFLMASARDFGVEDSQALKAAAALEMMHAASLIHDDLPSIDNDDYRRGKPSNHMVFGEDVSIMAGDLLFSLSLNLCDRLENTEVSKAFSKTLTELVDGETRDILMSKSEKRPTTGEILRMYEKKTGALFAFAFSFGPRMIGSELTEGYERSGYDFGVSFQIYDDISDVTSTFESIGKTPGKDLSQNKATLTRELGIEVSRKTADTLYERALLKLKTEAILSEFEIVALELKKRLKV